MVREFLSWEDMARIEVNAPDLPGILVDVGTTRLYPFGPTLAHVVGYVAPPNDSDVAEDPMLALPGIRVGRAGVEKFHDLALRGRAGAVQLEVNAVGRVIRELDRQEGTPGQEITLTIDTELQKIGARPARRRERQRRGDGLPATARCWRWPPTRRSTRACSTPASRRRNGSSGPTTAARR